MQQTMSFNAGDRTRTPDILLKRLSAFASFLGEKARRTQRDSNPRHLIPKTSALSAELWVHHPDYIMSVNFNGASNLTGTSSHQEFIDLFLTIIPTHQLVWHYADVY